MSIVSQAASNDLGQEIAALVARDAEAVLNIATTLSRSDRYGGKSAPEIVKAARAIVERQIAEGEAWKAQRVTYERERADYMAKHGVSLDEWLQHCQAEARRKEEAHQEERRYQKAYREVQERRMEERARWGAENAKTPAWAKALGRLLDRLLLTGTTR
jgi:hypothetical protein